MIGIYKITNKINGKSYIGQSIHCGKRFDEHGKGKQLIDEVIQIDGVDNFTFEILREVEKEELSIWEDYYIAFYNTIFPNGYNKRWNCSKIVREAFIKQAKSEIIKKEIDESRSYRKVNALNYIENEKTKLTKKQYLVYSFLLANSELSTKNNEVQYRIYKSNFTITEVCKYLGIDWKTFKTALQKLEQGHYIKIYDEYYTIETSERYVQLEINLIKFLFDYSLIINGGANIIEVYSTIYYYWQYCEDTEQECLITTNNLRRIFNSKLKNGTYEQYRFMIDLFEFYDLIKVKKRKKIVGGDTYTIYIIQKVELSLPKINENNQGTENADNTLNLLNASNRLY